MRRISGTIAFMVSLVIISTSLRAADEKPTTQPASALDHVAPFIGGEWRIKATWSGGNALDARAIYEWGLNKKFVVARTWVKNPADGTEYQRYETIFADEDGKLIMYSFTFNGEAHVRPMDVDGKKISNVWTVAGKDGTQTKLKQAIELVDPDHFHWQVMAQDKDGKWQSMMDGTWERVATAAAK